MALEQEILEILACPSCKGEFKQKEEALICEPCKLSFSVTDGVPCLLIEEATKL